MRSLVFSLIFLGFFSAQGQVFSELEFKLQQKDFKSLLKQSGLLDSAISLDKELNFALNGSEMSFKKLRALGDINIKEVLQKEEGFQLQALSPQFSLLVEDFRLRTFKKITVGKVSANIRIELHCPVARAQFKGLGAAASLSFPWKVKNLDLDLDSQKLSIDLSQCQGTKGLEGEYKKR